MSASGDVAQDPWSAPGPGPGTGVATVPDAEALRRPSDSPLRTAMRRLRRNKMAMVCLGIVIFFVLIAIFADLLTKLEGEVLNDYHLDLVDDYGFPRIGPTSDHWFGVQPHDGRDVFARWVYGARPSLIIAFIASLASTFFGVLVGLVSGYLGGRVDAVISWIIDLVLSLPYLLFAVAMVPIIVSIAGGVDNVTPEGNAQIRFFVLLFVLVFFGWAGLARLIRGEVLSLKQREFVDAAKVLGVPTWRLLRRELLPNLVAPIIIQFTLALPAYIVAEAGLSYLGVGLIDPIPSWGQMIDAATNYYAADPLFLWLPVLGVSVLTLALSWFGDSVRDAFDPKARR
ncbi:MAG: ABC transporter permease [Actinomycetales bacterium]|jgi:peptide/nickel transport system permease protein|nr:ABC transporter permease [Candidatus Lutibacillus vidarii]HRB98523.1 ABC transporter permease [Dermatophilaceae bacterium]